MQFGLNKRVVDSIKRNMQQYPERYENSLSSTTQLNEGEFKFDFEEFNNIKDIQSKTMGLDSLRKDKLKKDEYNHAYLWWYDIDRTLETHLKGFSANQCKTKRSRITTTIQEKLLQFIFDLDQSIDEQGEPFTDLAKSIDDDKFLEDMEKKMKYQMNKTEIKSWIQTELLEANLSIDYDTDEDDDIKNDADDNDFDEKDDEDLSEFDKYIENGCIIGKKVDLKYVVCVLH